MMLPANHADPKISASSGNFYREKYFMQGLSTPVMTKYHSTIYRRTIMDKKAESEPLNQSIAAIGNMMSISEIVAER